MGAERFETVGRGPTAQEAFRKAVDDARYEFGHGGYTGTIAEKDSFVLVPAPVLPIHLAEKLSWTLLEELENDKNTEVGDKWGPAAAIECLDKDNQTVWLFFGWASC